MWTVVLVAAVKSYGQQACLHVSLLVVNCQDAM
jgi:hypothetical protein